MADRIGPCRLEHAGDRLRIDDVGDMQRHAGGQVVPRAGGEIIEHLDVVPRRQEAVDDMAANESGTAGDKDVHECVRSNLVWAGSRGLGESLPGESPLKLLQGDHTFATFACKRSKKQPFPEETVSLEAAHPMCPEENRYGPPARAAGFSAFRPRNIGSPVP